MGSEQNHGTSFSASEPKLCANGCGFFGTATNMNLCSKCYRSLLLEEERATKAKAAMEKPLNLKSVQQDLIDLNKQVEVMPVEEPHPHAGSSSSSAAVAGSRQAEAPNSANRCFSCKRKVRLMGFKCKCGSTFCGEHRYPEKHGCSFDFKSVGRDAIAKANPIVKAEKLDKC